MPSSTSPSALTEEHASTDGRAVVLWLAVIYVTVLLMVLIGGTTRLTGSGLSIVEWRPLMGIIPPTSEEAWHAVFARYKEFPQYKLVNSWMDLEAFKEIFFWEYFHRLIGRLLALVVFVPWLYFVARKMLSRTTSRGALIAILLGGGQGLLGWYMVKSGLIHHPEVSHFRLAAHLLLALVVSQWVLWLILEIKAPWRIQKPLMGGLTLPLSLMALLYLQIAFGAFVAGKRAGIISSTFPDMNGHYLPGPFFSGSNVFTEMVNDPVAIHYCHRLIGTVLLVAFMAAGVHLIRCARTAADRRLGSALLGMTLVQFTLGVVTVMQLVAVPWAVAHQAGAAVLLGLVTVFVHRQMGGSSNGAGAELSTGWGTPEKA